MEHTAGRKPSGAGSAPPPPPPPLERKGQGPAQTPIAGGIPIVIDGKAGIGFRLPMGALIDDALHPSSLKTRTVQKLDAKGRSVITQLNLHLQATVAGGDGAIRVEKRVHSIPMEPTPLARADAPLARAIAQFIQVCTRPGCHPVPEARMRAISQHLCQLVRQAADSNLGWMLGLLPHDLGTDQLEASALRAYLEPLMAPATGLSALQRLAGLRALAQNFGPGQVPVRAIEAIVQCAQATLDTCTDDAQCDEVAQSAILAIGPGLAATEDDLSAVQQAIVQLDLRPPSDLRLFANWLLAMGEGNLEGRYAPALVEWVLQHLAEPPVKDPLVLCNLVCCLTTQCIDLEAPSPQAVGSMQQIADWSIRRKGEAAEHALSGFVQGLVMQRRLEPRHLADFVSVVAGLGARLTAERCAGLIEELIEHLRNQIPLTTAHVREFLAGLQARAATLGPDKVQRMIRALFDPLGGPMAGQAVLSQQLWAVSQLAASQPQSARTWINRLLVPADVRLDAAELVRVRNALLATAPPPAASIQVSDGKHQAGDKKAAAGKPAAQPLIHASVTQAYQRALQCLHPPQARFEALQAEMQFLLQQAPATRFKPLILEVSKAMAAAEEQPGAGPNPGEEEPSDPVMQPGLE